jgi:U3 small nucleolar RNA-associated protein 14
MDEESAGEFFDVLDVFDGRADVENDDEPPPKVDKKLQDRKTRATEVEDEEEWGGAQDADVDMSGDEDEDEEDEEEADSAVDEDDELRISASDSEDSSPGALADLETFLSNLDPAASHKRKPDEVAEPGPKKRRRVTDRTEAGEESEFGVRGTYMHRYHLSDILISIQARVLSSWTTFLPHSHLPLPSLPSRNQRDLSHRPARKRKHSPRHYLSEHKNVSTEKLHMNKRKKRWTNGRPR